jgi:serine/threonine-protein kinase
MSVPAESLQIDPLVGRCIGDRFHLTSLIARGGMAAVYRAEQAPFGRVCAVKLLGPDRAGADEISWALDRRFVLESTISARLNHPNIVTVFDSGRTEDGIRYLAMEYLTGRTLLRAIREAGALPEQRAVHIARQVCRALGAAHAAGVVHRDVKPANVFLVEGREEPDLVKLLDFGLVTQVAGDRGEELTGKNLLLGSPRYMAPEQIRGDAVDARTDVYALGVVIYEMVTGRAPFEGPGSGRVLAAHLDDAVPPMRTRDGGRPSPPLERMVRRCLEKRPDRRFRSMDEVRCALESLVAEPPAAAPRTGGPERLGRAFPGLRESVMAGALAVLVIAAIVGSTAHRARGASGTPRAGAAPSATVGLQAESPGHAVTIEVTVSPEDTVVREGNVDLCRSAPCAIVYEGRDADRGATHLLTFSHDGYRSRTVRVAALDGALTVELAPSDPVAPQAPRPVARPVAPAPTLRAASAVPVSGYRLDVPY